MLNRLVCVFECVLSFKHNSQVGTASRPVDKMPSIDGWRALSIIMVLFAHSTDKPGFSAWCAAVHCPFLSSLLSDGYLGVRFFFVISGFLITYLLIREQVQNHTVSLKKFYVRRGLRILPVYFAYLAVVAMLQLVTDLHQGPITWVGDLTFTANYLTRDVISGHLWSLSVEEQFYLLWPVIFVWLNKNQTHARWAFVLPVAVALLCHAISYAGRVPWMIHPLFNGHSALVNFDALAVGCLAAFMLAKFECKIAGLLSGGRRFIAILAGLLLITISQFNIPFLAPVLAVTGNLLQALGFGMLLITSILYPGSFRPLNWPLVVQLGVVSYSVYIWQEIFCAPAETFGCTTLWWLSFPRWVLVAITVGFVSYYGFERPWLKLRARFRTN